MYLDRSVSHPHQSGSGIHLARVSGRRQTSSHVRGRQLSVDVVGTLHMVTVVSLSVAMCVSGWDRWLVTSVVPIYACSVSALDASLGARRRLPLHTIAIFPWQRALNPFPCGPTLGRHGETMDERSRLAVPGHDPGRVAVGGGPRSLHIHTRYVYGRYR